MARQPFGGLVDQLFEAEAVVVLVELVHGRGQVLNLVVQTEEALAELGLSVALHDRPLLDVLLGALVLGAEQHPLALCARQGIHEPVDLQQLAKVLVEALSGGGREEPHARQVQQELGDALHEFGLDVDVEASAGVHQQHQFVELEV